MSVTMFFKNRRKNHLQRQLHKLEKSVADLQSSIEEEKQAIDDIDAFFRIHQDKADKGDEYSLYILSLNRNKFCNLRDSCKKNCDALSQLLLNDLKEISRLKEELNNLK